MSGSYWQKRKERTENIQVDDWLMTYADMITLLLCFFAVFLAISIPEENLFENAKRKVVEQFSGVATGPAKGQYDLPPAELDVTPQHDLPFMALPSIVDRYRGEVPPLEVKDSDTPEGDRIITIEMNTAQFYAPGSAALNQEGVGILHELLPDLSSSTYADYTISVEGYTDDIPINTAAFPSNWELSTARAASVVRSLIDMGIAPERLRAVGYGETNPKHPNRAADGTPIPENQAQNRRVVIRLEKIEKAE